MWGGGRHCCCRMLVAAACSMVCVCVCVCVCVWLCVAVCVAVCAAVAVALWLCGCGCCIVAVWLCPMTDACLLPLRTAPSSSFRRPGTPNAQASSLGHAGQAIASSRWWTPWATVFARPPRGRGCWTKRLSSRGTVASCWMTTTAASARCVPARATWCAATAARPCSTRLASALSIPTFPSQRVPSTAPNAAPKARPHWTATTTMQPLEVARRTAI